MGLWMDFSDQIWASDENFTNEFRLTIKFNIYSNFPGNSQSSRPEVFCKKDVFRNFAIHRKTPVPESQNASE